MILHRFYFNLDQSDKKSDQLGILGPPRPFIIYQKCPFKGQFSLAGYAQSSVPELKEELKSQTKYMKGIIYNHITKFLEVTFAH